MSNQLEDNAKYANWLIRIGSFLAANTELFPDGCYIWSNEFQSAFYGDSAKENLLAATRAVRKEFKTTQSRKNYNSSTFDMVMEIPDSWFEFRFSTPRTNVCRKVDTGETITKEVRDYNAAPMVTVEEPVVRWECDPAILAE